MKETTIAIDGSGKRFEVCTGCRTTKRELAEGECFEASECNCKAAGIPEYTPGPWTFGGSLANGNYFIYPSNSKEAIAGVRRLAPSRDVGENEANARLIASAPELLDALKLAEAALLDLGACDDEECDCPRVLVTVRKAIAKAEGKIK